MDSNGKVFCFQMNLDFILDMLMDDYIFDVVVENSIKMSVWSSVTDGRQKCHHLGQNPL